MTADLTSRRAPTRPSDALVRATSLTRDYPSGDGIVHDSKGRHFYISEVRTGNVFRYNADGTGRTPLGTGLLSAADHYLDEDAGVLIVPDSKAGNLVFLRL